MSWAEEVGSWDDDNPSDQFEIITKLIAGHNVDAQHLDSAFKAGITVFLTSDKTDIWCKRAEIFELLGLHVLHMPTQVESPDWMCCFGNNDSFA